MVWWGGLGLPRSRGEINCTHQEQGRETERAVSLSLYIHLWEYRTLFTEWSSWRVTHNPALVVLSDPSVFHHQRVQSGLVLQISSPTDTLGLPLRGRNYSGFSEAQLGTSTVGAEFQITFASCLLQPSPTLTEPSLSREGGL